VFAASTASTEPGEGVINRGEDVTTTSEVVIAPGDNLFSPENAPSNKFVRTGLIIHDWKWKKIVEEYHLNLFAYSAPAQSSSLAID